MKPVEAEDWDERPDELRSCDKGNHAIRSIKAQPNHLKFWKKLSKKHPPSSRSINDGLTEGTTVLLDGEADVKRT